MSYIPICVPCKLRLLTYFRYWHLLPAHFHNTQTIVITVFVLSLAELKVFCGYAYENLQPPYVENGLGRIWTPYELIKAVQAYELQAHITAYNGQHSEKYWVELHHQVFHRILLPFLCMRDRLIDVVGHWTLHGAFVHIQKAHFSTVLVVSCVFHFRHTSNRQTLNRTAMCNLFAVCRKCR